MQFFKLFLFLLFSLLVSRCGWSDPVAEHRINSPPEKAEVVETRGERGGLLRYPLAGEPSSFNYVAASETRTRLVAYLTTATLLQYNPLEQEVTGGICEDFKFSQDGLTVTVTLREGILFSDGVPLTTEDVVFTFQKIFDPDSKNVLKESLLINGSPIQVEKIDEYSLVIRFPEPYAAAKYILATIPVLPRHRFLDSERKIEDYWTLNTPPEDMCGLGPFTLSAHEPGIRTVFRPNPYYWKVDVNGTQLPYLDQLVLEYLPDSNNRILRLRAGELDLLDYLLKPEDMRYLEREGNVELRDEGPSSNLALYWFNLNIPDTGRAAANKQRWFSRREFRQAINCSIDKTSIVSTVFQGLATEATSLVPSSNHRWHIDELPGCSGEREAARELLKTAGFSWRQESDREALLDESGEVVAFELLTPTNDLLGKIAAIIQQDLGAIGINLSIRQEEFRAVTSRIMMTRDYDSALMLLDFPVEPADTVNVLFSSGSLHMWNPRQDSPETWWEERVDQLMREQVQTFDHERRFRLFYQVQKLLAEERPFIPLVNRNVFLAHRKGLENLKPATTFPFSLWNVWELSWRN